MTSSANIAASALWALVALVMFYAIARGYTAYRIDAFREQMFSLREELFDLAASGQLQFDAPAYGMLRTTMNGFIRYGHRVNVVSLVIFVALVPEEQRSAFASDTPLVRLPCAIASLAPETRETLEVLRRRMQFAVLEQLLFGSPLFVLGVVLLFPLVLVRQASKHVVTHLVSSVFRRFETRLEAEFFPAVEGRAYLDGEQAAGADLALA